MLNPQTLKILDPACGSGHILVEAYDILKDIYLERGYRLRDIPRLILENNLYGLDIDDRAAQLAGFALLMKARADDRRILENPPTLNILALVESNDWQAPSNSKALAPYFDQLITLFQHAKTFGSLIQIPSDLAEQLPALEAHLLEISQQGDLLDQLDAKNLLPLVRQAHILAMKFDAVVANPPYMGGKGIYGALKDFAKKHFPDSKSDMFSMFMERCQDFGNDAASLSFVTPYVWMFISSYEGIRTKLLNNATLQSLIQLEYNAFEPACVPVCTFIVGKTHIPNYTGSYIKLSDFKGHENQAPKTLEAINNPNCGWFYNAKPDDFKKISGSPIAYWVSEKLRSTFEDYPSLKDVANVKQGLATADNNQFLRLWYETDINRIGFGIANCEEAKKSLYKWFPYNKGGEFRKWYGNHDFVVNWENDGEEIKNFGAENGEKARSRAQNTNYYFQPSVSWSFISSSNFGVRYYPRGFIFDVAGSSAIPHKDLHEEISAFLCSSVALTIMGTMNPTMNFQVGNVEKLPFISSDAKNIGKNCIEIAKTDWNNYETSWDFTENPLIRQKQPTLKAAFEQWQTQNRAAIDEMKRLEEENNRLFIEAYGLQDELSPDVPEEQITLVRADREKDSVRLISYAIGCMMGRYSLDEAGLIYAGGDLIADGTSEIVPITDELWFVDDAAERVGEFLQTVWGAENLETNKAWLAESLGIKNDETADETLRRYLANHFYKTHLQTYKKRPIYWCFSSGKHGAFQALVYLHRYNESTLARMRNNYAVPLMSKIQNRIEMLEKDRDAATSPASKNKIGKEIERFNKKKIELSAFDEKLRHYADMRISLDLDDGVKVNYGKFGDLLAEVKAVTGGEWRRMSYNRITESLNALFEVHNVIFWHDIENEFSAEIETLTPENVELVRLDNLAALQIKMDVEKFSVRQRLIYSNQPEPNQSKDWLLDIRLRSKAFKADSTSILLDDLGLTSQQVLRDYLKSRAKFCRSKERVERLKRFIVSTDNAENLDCKMLAVLTRADQPELFTILLRLFANMVNDNEVELNPPKLWQDIVSNDLENAFWQLTQTQFGYNEAEPNLRDLLFRILVTDFVHNLRGETPKSLQHFVLPERNLASNAAVFASRWRSDITHYANYNLISGEIAHELALVNGLTNLCADDLRDVMTFEVVEKRIISDLKSQILNGVATDSLADIISKRRDGHWAMTSFATHDVNRALSACYDALEAAISFISLQEKYHDGFSFTDAETGFACYTNELFQFDQFYRHFHRATELVEPMGWGLLHDLKERIENAYSGWFMPQLSSTWASVLEGETGLLSTWQVPNLTNQYDFYTRNVKPLLDGKAKRIFVVLSDALRYEVAQELTTEINRKNRLKAELSTMLGVLPSYTRLGMASLLPHKTLAYRINSNLDVLTDGKAVSSMEQRAAYLESYTGTAIKAEDLLALGKDKGREFIREHQLIYVYHDRIDLIGDKQASETKTFEAAEETINELSQLISFIANNFGSTVLVTADHGFLYQESALEQVDKSTLDEKPAGTLHAKKRYLLGQQLGRNEKAWAGNTAITAGTETSESLDFWIPKGVNRFHFAGGARFVHGGAMPQEIVIPVITVRATDNESAKIKEVGISLLGASNKVVTNMQCFEFIQTEAVSERLLSRTVIISLRDGDTPISNEQTLTFDSASSLLEDRKRKVLLTILSGNYDRNKDYYLVVRDAKTQVELQRETLKVDLSFSNDF